MNLLLSLMGMFGANPHLFDRFEIIMGSVYAEDLESAYPALQQRLLLETAELEILYPDPETLETAINAWGLSMHRVWAQLYRSTKFNYAPLENYAKKEQYIDNGTTNPKTTIDSSNSSVPFNGSAFSEREKTKTTQTTSNVTSNTRQGDVTGRFGVSAQSLIEDERKIAKFNLDDYIIQDFKNRFCLVVY